MSEAAPPPSRPSGAETARHTLRVISAVADLAPVGLDALADAAGLKRGTAYRLVRVLQEEGWIERLGSGGYQLGAGFIGLATRAAPVADVDLARPGMQDLSDHTGETVTLHRRAGDLGVLVAGTESSRSPLRLVTVIGEVLPLVAGCSGQAILAFAGRDDLTAVVRRQCPPSDIGSVVAELDAVAEAGWARSSGVHHPGVTAIAVPVRSVTHPAVRASLVISGPAVRWDAARARSFLPDLVAAAAVVADLLGG